MKKHVHIMSITRILSERMNTENALLPRSELMFVPLKTHISGTQVQHRGGNLTGVLWQQMKGILGVEISLCPHL